jgi:hypothetical protein
MDIPNVRFGPIADIRPWYSVAVLPAGPVINICAITWDSLIYQFGEATTKLSIKNVFDAFYAFIMR